MSTEGIEVDLQRKYYAETANNYDAAHVQDEDEHFFGLAFLAGMLDLHKIGSVLDVGSGTGRAITYLASKSPNLRIAGIEPVKELRDVAVANGVPEGVIIDGDATRLPFKDGEFDVVCAFGVLHHIRRPDHAIAEMLRVAKKAIFISDANNFGRGSLKSRVFKQVLNALKLWPLFIAARTKGKGYFISPGDGLFYSYSVYNSFEQIRSACKAIHVVNTTPGGVNPYRTASHVALLGLKS